MHPLPHENADVHRDGDDDDDDDDDDDGDDDGDGDDDDDDDDEEEEENGDDLVLGPLGSLLGASWGLLGRPSWG